MIDPAGGAYYVESLTDALAAAAWGLFQELEAGASLVERIEATHRARSQDVATRRLPLTGVSEFPDLDESPVIRPRPPGESAPGESDNGLRRLAAPFEALRDAADAAPTRPTVFLASLGPMEVHTARSTFASNLMAAGGISATAGEGFSTPVEAAAAWSLSGSPVAVICSSDDVYAESAADAVAALKEAGCEYVLLAGRPDDRWGADAYVYLGCDALAALRAIHDRLGL